MFTTLETVSAASYSRPALVFYFLHAFTSSLTTRFALLLVASFGRRLVPSSSTQLAIQLQLTETWNREIKVAKNVTHPQMTMSAAGGYILTGVKVNQVEVVVEKKGKHVGKGIGAIKGRKRKAPGGAGAGDGGEKSKKKGQPL